MSHRIKPWPSTSLRVFHSKAVFNDRPFARDQHENEAVPEKQRHLVKTKDGQSLSMATCIKFLCYKFSAPKSSVNEQRQKEIREDNCIQQFCLISHHEHSTNTIANKYSNSTLAATCSYTNQIRNVALSLRASIHYIEDELVEEKPTSVLSLSASSCTKSHRPSANRRNTM